MVHSDADNQKPEVQATVTTPMYVLHNSRISCLLSTLTSTLGNDFAGIIAFWEDSNQRETGQNQTERQCLLKKAPFQKYPEANVKSHERFPSCGFRDHLIN